MDLKFSREDIIEIYQLNTKFLDEIEYEVFFDDLEWCKHNNIFIELATRLLYIAEEPRKQIDFLVLNFKVFGMRSTFFDMTLFTYLDERLQNLRILKNLRPQDVLLLFSKMGRN